MIEVKSVSGRKISGKKMISKYNSRNTGFEENIGFWKHDYR